MGDRSYGPVEIPPDFWSRPDVRDALWRSDIRSLFDLVQKWTGASQMRIAGRMPATATKQRRVVRQSGRGQKDGECEETSIARRSMRHVTDLLV